MLYCFSFQLSDSQTPQALIGIILFDADLSVYGVEGGGGGGIWVAGCSAPLVSHSSVGGGGHSSSRWGGEGRFLSF